MKSDSDARVVTYDRALAKRGSVTNSHVVHPVDFVLCRPSSSRFSNSNAMATPPSRRMILSLYSKMLRTSHSFSSYNFRNYFIRRTKTTFRTIQVCSTSASFRIVLTSVGRPNQTQQKSTHYIRMPCRS